MKTFVIVHGWDGDSRIGWFKWLKDELEKRGHKVLTPLMPNPGEPVIDKWVGKLFDTIKNPNKDTYFIGHSIGCQTILRYLEKYNVTIGGTIFVAGWFDLKEESYGPDPQTEKEGRRIARPWIKNKINLSKIKIPKSFAIFSDNDPFVDEKTNSKIFEQKIGSKIIIESKKNHYEEGKYDKIPVILDIIDSLEENKMQSHYVREHFTIKNNERGEIKMKHELPKLGYKYDALEPYIDAKTMEIHHTKHHQTYVDKLNAAIEPYAGLTKMTVEELLKSLDKVPEQARNAVRNHGGGHYNHTMFWTLLKKDVKISKSFNDVIIKSFGSFEAFKKQFSDASLNRFGSGWAWLVVNNGKLEIVSTANQDSPISEGKIPILGIDMWEHAMYLKFQNRKAEYIEAFFNVINWKQVETLYNSALKGKSFSV